MAKPPKPPKRAGVSGVLIVDKPSGPTSFDVVAQVRRRYHVRSVGHAGTLDPLASGVLVVMLGEATKLSEYLTAADKRYRAEITFGRSTDTLDSTGQTLDARPLRPGEVAESRVQAALEMERARKLQVPPVYSAIKQGGETAYKKARRGETVELTARPVKVTALELIELTETGATLDVHVSKGYYVRSLARDVCEFLGVPGCLSGLRRLASGVFTLEHATVWPPAGDENPPLLSTSQAATAALPNGMLNAQGELFARQGKRLTEAHFARVPPCSPAVWLGPSGRLLALGESVPSDSTHQADPTSNAPNVEPQFRVLRGFLDTD